MKKNYDDDTEGEDGERCITGDNRTSVMFCKDNGIWKNT